MLKTDVDGKLPSGSLLKKVYCSNREQYAAKVTKLALKRTSPLNASQEGLRPKRNKTPKLNAVTR